MFRLLQLDHLAADEKRYVAWTIAWTTLWTSVGQIVAATTDVI